MQWPVRASFGTSATDFFCGAVATGSKGLVALLHNPTMTLLTIAALLALLVWAATHEMAACGSPAGRAPTQVGADPRRRRADVRQARASLPRHRRPAHPARDRHLRPP